MPSSEKHPSRVPMREGVKYAYILVAMCIYPITIAGYWAYGQLVLYFLSLYPLQIISYVPSFCKLYRDKIQCNILLI